MDVHCQDINPADDVEKNPVRQSLREKVWDWLFDPKQTKKSYLLLLGDFGTGKTTFCFYMGQEIITPMNSLDMGSSTSRHSSMASLILFISVSRDLACV